MLLDDDARAGRGGGGGAGAQRGWVAGGVVGDAAQVDLDRGLVLQRVMAWGGDRLRRWVGRGRHRELHVGIVQLEDRLMRGGGRFRGRGVLERLEFVGNLWGNNRRLSRGNLYLLAR